MNPAKLDLEIYQGSIFRKGFQWKIQSTDLPMDLTDCQIKMQIKESACSEVALIELTTTNGKIVIESAIDGKWTIEILSADTATLSPIRYVYDMDITFPSGDVFTVCRGIIKVIEDVTV